MTQYKCCKSCARWSPIIAVSLGLKPCSIMGRMLDKYEWVNPMVDAMEWLMKFTEDYGCELWEDCDTEKFRSLRTYAMQILSKDKDIDNIKKER